ncbi:MAG: ABC transporter ATP-binding protein [Anaerolineae bacterium]|nr:MAG: ABC transporter ATP-binding protein [Anaerolineae bacterium]
MPPIFECEALVKNFGGLSAVNHFDLRIEQGEIVSLIGPNGAGKTTFFNLVTGFYPPDSGIIRSNGHDLVGLSPYQITQQGVARTFQNVRLFPNMTVLENVMVGQHSRTKNGVLGAILRLPSFKAEEEAIRQKAKEQLDFFGTRLSGYRLDEPAYRLSYANRRRLEIARAMATEANLLLMDEPSAGMNPKETEEITELIGQLRDERGFTILFIEHDMRVVKGVSDRVVAMDFGTKIAEGSYETVAQDDRVIEAYLGRTSEDGADGR